MTTEVHPSTRFVTTTDGVRIACSLIGEGPPVLFVRGVNSHLDSMWQDDATRSYFLALAARRTLVRFDVRGNGLSDRPEGPITFDALLEDVRAVVDGLELERAVVFGQGFGGPIAIAYAAEHPARVSDLILYCTCANGKELRGLHRLAELFRTAPDAAYAWLAFQTYPRAESIPARGFLLRSMRPEQAAEMFTLVAETDVTERLGRVGAPTLILHPQGFDAITPAMARELAAGIPDARLRMLPGGSYNPWAEDAEASLALIREFLGDPTDEREPSKRAVTTVLFTDVVGSTRLAAEIGDKAWRELLEQHHAVTHAQVARAGGRHVQDTGDGILAAFPGPAAAIGCAFAIRAELRKLGLEITAGIHTGEVEFIGEGVGGIAVHLAARVCEGAGPGEVLVSRTVVDLLAGSRMAFSDLGEWELKGVPGRWTLFRVDDA